MGTGKVRWGIEIIRLGKDVQSIGIGLSRDGKEAYLFANLLFWQLTIGRFWKWDD